MRQISTMSELASLSLAEVSVLLERHEVSSVELVQACFTRADEWEPHIHALLARLDEGALAEARKADLEMARGRRRGPLHGIPIMVKDLIDVAGVATTAGSRILHDNVPKIDAPVIANLRRAGAIVTAKTNTHEFALGALTPPTRNPWDRQRMPGGSSGGSGAAVASGITYGALGTDTAGSIREPAAFCGIVGLKPTFGLVSKVGVVPLAWSLDTVGPMARTIDDCSLLLSGMDAYDPSDRSSLPPAARPAPRPTPALSGLRIAVASELMTPIQSDVRVSVEGVLSRLRQAGAHVAEVSIGDPDEIVALTFIILASEAAAYHRKWMESCPELYTPDVLRYLELGMLFKAMDYIDALRVRRLHQRRISSIFAKHDVIVTPAQLTTAPLVTVETITFTDGVERPRDETLIRPLSPFSLTGLPAVSIPIGLGANGLPIGLQLVASAYQEELLLGAAKLVQQLTQWKPSEPSLTS
jgi:aspartyl-tRNA(Asn)/glutamyl-tRNA(Gln) amidotransferase subunit A